MSVFGIGEADSVNDGDDYDDEAAAAAYDDLEYMGLK